MTEEETAWEAYLCLLLTPEQSLVYDCITDKPQTMNEIVSRVDWSWGKDRDAWLSTHALMSQLLALGVVDRFQANDNDIWFSYTRKAQRPPCVATEVEQVS